MLADSTACGKFKNKGICVISSTKILFPFILKAKNFIKKITKKPFNQEQNIKMTYEL